VDDIGHGDVGASITFIVRAPKNSKLSVQSVRVSGKEIVSDSVKWDAPVDVGTIVLIDAGTPGSVHLPLALDPWVKELASKRPDWKYRFIAGDQNGCLVSRDLTKDSKRESFQKRLTQAPSQALSDNPPVAEQMQEMVALFSTDAHRLVVLAARPPVWLPREITEWMTRDPRLTQEDRKTRGQRQQFKVRSGDAEAIHEIAEWIRSGHLRIVIVPEPNLTGGALLSATPANVTMQTPQEVADRWTPLRHGVEDILMGLRMPESAGQLLNDETPAQFAEYRGTLKAPMSELQQLTSGAYTAEVTFSAGNTSIPTPVTPMIDRAVKNWTPELLRKYDYLPYVALFLIVAILIAERLRARLKYFDADFTETSRNCIFACAGLVFAIASNLTTTTSSRQQYETSRNSLLCGSLLVVLGIIYWIGYEHRLKTAREVPNMDKYNHA
jgi:hypothetical protein